MRRFSLSVVAGCCLLAAGSAAADEVRLTDTAMDRVTAGFLSGDLISLLFGAGATPPTSGDVIDPESPSSSTEALGRFFFGPNDGFRTVDEQSSTDSEGRVTTQRTEVSLFTGAERTTTEQRFTASGTGTGFGVGTQVSLQN